MEIKEKREIEKVISYFCDVCKKRRDEVAILGCTWGYFSRKDGVVCECHLCEICYDKVVKFIRDDLKGEVREKDLFSSFIFEEGSDNVQM